METRLPGLSGLALLAQLHGQNFRLPVIIVTDIADADIRAQARRFGAADVLEKPVMNAFLLARLKQLLPGAIDLAGAAPSTVKLRDGTPVTFRVMRPEDADIEQAFVRGLSDRSRYLRFFSNIKQLSPYMLERLTNPDYPKSYALMATVSGDDRERQIGVARYAPTELDGVAEFAVVVADDWQGHGIATHLLNGLTTAAAVAGIRRLEGLVLKENDAMQQLARALGFSISSRSHDATTVRVVKSLGSPDSVTESQAGLDSSDP